MPAVLPAVASPVQPVAAGGVQATTVPAAPLPAAATVQGEALVVESGDGFAVVAFDGRLLGLDGPLQVPAGSRLGLRLPQGSPGIGGSAAGMVSTRQADLTVEVPVTVRLAARHGAAVPVQVTDIASGAGMQALFVPLPDSGYGPRRGTAGELGRGPLIAVVVDDGAEDAVLLHTAAGSFRLPRGEAVPPAGSQVALLRLSPVERRETGRTPDETRPEPRGDGGTPAPASEAATEPGLVPSAPARIPAQPPVGLPLAIGPAGSAAAGLAGSAAGIAVEPDGGGSERDRVDRLLIAVELSRLGPVQIELRRSGETCDIVLRSQLALDGLTRNRIGEAVRAAAGGRIALAFATGLAAAGDSAP